MSSSLSINKNHKIENEAVLVKWDYIIFTMLTIISWAAIARFCHYWLSLKESETSLLWYAVGTVLILRYLGLNQMLWFALLLMKRPKPATAEPGLRVAVVTTFVPGLESIEMLEETLKALIELKYPHETWLLDEGNSPEAISLCTRLGAHHFSRLNMSRYQAERGTFKRRSKSGNYNSWLYEIGFDNYDILVNFDPDHVPHKDFLLHVLGYFKNPTVGFVQAAQVYYNQPASFIARGAAEETYAFYSVTQMAYHGLGHPVVTGCHTAQKMIALREVGGFPVHDADDTLITLLYRAKGWKGIYVPKILAVGLTPVDWNGYIKQQFRWARSVIDIKLRAYPRLVGHLPLIDKAVALLHGLYYLQGLETLFSTCLLVFILSTGILPSFVSWNTVAESTGLGLVLLLVNFYKQRFFLNPVKEWGIHWRAAILQVAKWPFFLIGFLDAVLGKERTHTRTSKIKIVNRQTILLFPHSLIVLLIFGALAIGGRTASYPNTLPYVLAGISIFVELILIWTETRSFPPSFEAKHLSDYQNQVSKADRKL